jgi:tetratricopeptide (TPR) repeat protein
MSAKALREYEKGTQLLSKGDPQASLKHFLRAIQESPASYRPYHNLGLAYARLGQLEAAAQNFEKSIELSRSSFAPSFCGLAMVRYNQNEFGPAQTLLQHALLLEPTSSTGKYFLGMTQFSLGQISDAERSTREAIQLNPSLTDPYFLLARIHELQHNPSAVVADLNTYFKLAPSITVNPDALAFLYRAEQALPH